MKKYKRLTIRNGDGTVSQPYGENIVERVFYQLAELEDKIENGSLVELPCKIGDKIYFPHEAEEGVDGWIDEGTVTSICYDGKDFDFRAVYNSGLTFWHTINDQMGFFKKEEAERWVKPEEVK